MATKLNDINTKLVDISTQYSKFNKNQVLTETQLNGFLDYFDDQYRLSRTSLSGVGIVCGFRVAYNGSDFSVNITQGRGVTTDGDLLALQKKSTTEKGKKDDTLKSINLPSRKYRFYKKYIDDISEYNHFIGGNKKQINLWELYEETNDNDSRGDLKDFPNIENMVVLLYLENYSKEGDLCTKLSCDNQGIEQVAKLRVLLVSIDDAKYIASQDPIYNKHNWFETYSTLPEVQAKRVVLTSKNTKTYKVLKENYYNAIKTDNTLRKLKEGLDTIFRKFNQTSVTSEMTRIFHFNSNVGPVDFQYRYDVLKDIIDTYNEIKELLLHLNVHCCPQIGSFPKHLLLGKIKEDKPFLSLRHQFYKSPIIGHEDANYQKVVSLLKRVKDLLFNYRISNKGNAIKITPSRVCGELQTRAIPFYYNVNTPLLTNWSFQKTKNLKQKFNLSYHTGNLANVPSIRKPLEYSLDCFNFYRIEGHQGKMYRDALESIIKMREEYGLSFDVKALSIDATDKKIDLSKYKCQFEDLSVLLSAWTAEQNCILSEISNFLSGFSTKDAGANVVASKRGYEIMHAGVGIARSTEMIMEARELIEDKKSTRKKPRTQKELYKRNIVKEGLTVEDDTIGKLLEASFEKNEYGSVNDILAYFNNSTAEIKTSEQWKTDKELTEFVFKEVPEILVHTYVLDEKIPETILEIDDVTLSQYQLTIEELCRYVKKLQTKYQSVKIKDGSKQIIGLLINQLSTVCCSGKKLELLLTEIEKRKKEILIQIQLSEFVKTHPGLEHKAGVEPGGTFVMVYLTENEKEDSVYEDTMLELDFLTQPNVDVEGLEGDAGVLQLWNQRASTKFVFLNKVPDDFQDSLNEVVLIGKSVERTVFNFALFLNRVWKRAGVDSVRAKAQGSKLIIGIRGKEIPREKYFIQFSNEKIIGKDSEVFFKENTIVKDDATKKNVVVADFCLPFMFKSDCAPVNFIIPKEPVKLRLPEPYVCLREGEDLAPLLFEKSPVDGEIKAKVAPEIESGLSKNEDGKDVFDAQLTDESLYGKVIEFTVNDEETDCRITVYPDVQLSVSTDASYNNSRTVATVTYKVSEIIPGILYAWDFGKGNISDQKPDQDGIITREYQLPFNEENLIEPKLIISNGYCEKEIPIDVIKFEKPIDVSLAIQEKYCLDITKTRVVKIPFTSKNPTQGMIEIVGGIVNGLDIQNDQLIIDPKKFKVFDKEIKFTIEGIATSAKITICELMQIAIIKDPAGLRWINNVLHQRYFFGTGVPDGVDTNGLIYQWTINGKKVGSTKSINPNLLVAEGTNKHVIALEITDKNGCISTKTITETIKYPNFKLSMPNNKLDYCLNDDKSYLVRVSPDIFGTRVDGLGVFANSTGKPQFTPIKTGMTSAGSNPLSIAGKTLLTLSLKEAPRASFTAKVENSELILTNTSDIADTYIWTIGNNQPITRTNRVGVRLKTTTIDEDVIDITLTVAGPCGEDVFKISNFKIRNEVVIRNTSCIGETKEDIKRESAKLSTNLDVSRDIRAKIILPTVSIYNTTLAAPNQIFEGTGNANMLNGMTSLLNETAKQMFSSTQDTFTLEILSTFYRAQIRLLFNLLHCQPHTVLERDKRAISAALNTLRRNLIKMKSTDIAFDANGELKEFLTDYSNDIQVISYLRKVIVKLIPQIL
ncbi:MAG: hypothetical protein JXR05_08315 [Flavobacteriaceae bacterium]